MKTIKNIILCTLWVIQFVTILCDINANVSVEFDANSDEFSITDFISSYGYDVEVHVNIETEDGYLLDMFRIPNGKHTSRNSTKPVVLLMHGLFGSAENFVISGPNRGLAFFLADLGYDVWMGNARGTVHSKKHISLDADFHSSYWDYSWHEIGVYDLPAKIDYIIKETKQNDIFYIGHSQGTTAFFVMTSERPSYNGYIKLMIALGPVVFMSNIPHPGLRFASSVLPGVEFFSSVLGLNKFEANNEILKLAGQTVCRNQGVAQEICANILFLTAGYDSEELDRALVPLIVKTVPAGAASTKQIYHYGQEILSGCFCKYDYGLIMNLANYGSAKPPSYDLSRVTAPVALFYGLNDWLVAVEDVTVLASKLPNLVLNYQIPHKKFNHLDYLFATHVVELLYLQVNGIMTEFI